MSNSNVIIESMSGLDRIQLQHDDQGEKVKDTQFKILLNEIRDVKAEVKKNTKSISDLTKIVKKNHPQDFEVHILPLSTRSKSLCHSKLN